MEKHGQALAVHVRPVTLDVDTDPKRQCLTQFLHVWHNGIRHRQGGLIAHPVDVDHHGGLTIVGGVGIRILKSVDHRGDIFKEHTGAVAGGYNGDAGELLSVITPLRHTDQDLAPGSLDAASGEINGCLSYLCRDIIEGQVIGPQLILGYLDTDLQITNTGQVHLGNLRVLEEFVPDLFNLFPEYSFILITVQNQRDYLPSMRGALHSRVFRLIWKGVNTIDFVFNIPCQFLIVIALDHLDLYEA